MQPRFFRARLIQLIDYANTKVFYLDFISIFKFPAELRVRKAKSKTTNLALLCQAAELESNSQTKRLFRKITLPGA